MKMLYLEITDIGTCKDKVIRKRNSDDSIDNHNKTYCELLF